MSGKVKALTILSVLIVAGFTVFSFAQDEAPQSVVEQGGMGYGMFGTSIIDMSDLNAVLVRNGYSELSDSYFSVGGGGHSIINNKWIIGGEFHSLLGEEVQSGEFTTSMYIVHGFASVGYTVFQIQGLRLYPLIGIGGGAMNLTIKEKPASLSIDEVLDDPQRGVTLTAGGFLINVAVGADYFLQFGQDETGRGGMMLGLRAGYTLSPVKGGWAVDELEVTGAPKMGITGPYIRLMIGGGGFETKK